MDDRIPWQTRYQGFATRIPESQLPQACPRPGSDAILIRFTPGLTGSGLYEDRGPQSGDGG
ncbi:MAG: hypothetical protein OXI37_00410 [Gammaproteobacteria bacterium]|nr:hypothetical protein [Gammaproteobacteria bacterium]